MPTIDLAVFGIATILTWGGIIATGILFGVYYRDGRKAKQKKGAVRRLLSAALFWTIRPYVRWRHACWLRRKERQHHFPCGVCGAKTFAESADLCKGDASCPGDCMSKDIFKGVPNMPSIPQALKRRAPTLSRYKDSVGELRNLERLVREYVDVAPCTCNHPVSGVTCWPCIFRYNLSHISPSARQAMRQNKGAQ